MKIIFFKDLKEGQSFMFGELLYIKTSKDRGLSFAGSRVFNLMETINID